MSSDRGIPTSYEDIVNVLHSLPLIVEEKRRRERLSLLAAASDCGVSPSTIGRCEKGEDVQLSSAVALLSWIGGFR